MTDADILRERARRLAKPLVEDQASELQTAIVVEIADQAYAFPLADVRRAAVLGPLTPLPHVPQIVLGLGTAGGEVLAVFDSRVWAGSARRASSDRTPVLILGTTTAPLALAVDGFAGSLVFGALAPAAASAAWLAGITDEGVLVVHVAALLSDPMFSPGGTIDDHH